MFKKADSISNKKDVQGKVAIKVFLVDTSKQGGLFPINGNLKEEILLDDTTVGEVLKVVKTALFGEEDK